jgi:transposase
LLLPSEKPNKSVGCPLIPFRKVVDSILYVLRTCCEWKMLSKEYCSGSTCHRRFQEWIIKKLKDKIIKARAGVDAFWTYRMQKKRFFKNKFLTIIKNISKMQRNLGILSKFFTFLPLLFYYLESWQGNSCNL